MATIGFLSFSDFLEELKQTALWGQPVRVQEYHRSKINGEYLPLTHYTFCIEAAVENIADQNVLVCRFVTGRLSTLPQHGQVKLERIERRNRIAARILRQRLQAEGFPVGKGLIAAAAQSETEADPGGLWSEEDFNDDQDEPASDSPADQSPGENSPGENSPD